MEKIKNDILEKLFADAGIDCPYSFWKEDECDINGRHSPERYYAEFEMSSPAGEDPLLDVDFNPENPAGSLIENLKKGYQNFDPEEYAAKCVEDRGKNGVPGSIQELIDDAHAIDGMIKNLIFALEPKGEEPDTKE